MVRLITLENNLKTRQKWQHPPHIFIREFKLILYDIYIMGDQITLCFCYSNFFCIYVISLRINLNKKKYLKL